MKLPKINIKQALAQKPKFTTAIFALGGIVAIGYFLLGIFRFTDNGFVVQVVHLEDIAQHARVMQRGADAVRWRETVEPLLLQLCDEFTAAVRHHETRGAGGQQVSYLGPFASVGPTALPCSTIESVNCFVSSSTRCTLRDHAS